MKNRLMRVLALALLLALVVGAVPAMAATKATKSKTRSIVNETVYTGTDEYKMNLKGWTWEEGSVVITSSNPKVLRVEDETDIWLIPLKAGKAKIRVEFTLEGKRYYCENTYTVKKYPKPIKSLTINKWKIPLEGRNKYRYYTDFDLNKKLSVTINLKPAKGWKITKIKAYTLKTWSDKGKRSLTVKNNKKFKVAKDREAFVTYTLKKGKTKFNYTINIERAGE